MSLSSIGSANPYSYLQRTLQPDSTDPTDPTDAGAPSDPLQSLYQTLAGGNSSDPLISALSPDDGSDPSSGTPQFSPDVMQALFSVQGSVGNSGPSNMQSLIDKFDTNGDGQISQSEFENAIGPNADQSKVDALFNKLDANGDGEVTQDEMKSAMQKAHGGGHHHHHHAEGAGPQGSDPLQSLLSGTAADGTTSQSSSNSDGSTTTTITYSDGTKIEMTTPAGASDAGSNGGSSNPEAMNFSNMLKQLISLQAQYATPTTNLSV
jgi:Ca2+-binding EF-hand superfamily protein